jgi:hypothetical protein
MFNLGFKDLGPHMRGQQVLDHGYIYSFRSDLYYHVSYNIFIEYGKEGQQSSCRFLLELSSKPLLLDHLMSNIDGFPYDCIKKNDYINPIQLWIEEACNNTCQP